MFTNNQLVLEYSLSIKLCILCSFDLFILHEFHKLLAAFFNLSNLPHCQFLPPGVRVKTGIPVDVQKYIIQLTCLHNLYSFYL